VSALNLLAAATGTDTHATPAWAMLAYLIAGVCFILALRGLSSPTSSQQGNRFGMIGMLIAVLTTLVTHVPMHSVTSMINCPNDLTATCAITQLQPNFQAIALIIAAIAIGAVIGIVTARRIAMTDMPQLVAAFHSLVGLASIRGHSAFWMARPVRS
jgi:H+-translocating NAD(P) transhydrogenase subunit beta